MFNNISYLSHQMVVSSKSQALCKHCGCYPPIILTKKNMITDIFTMAHSLKGVCMSRNCNQTKTPEQRMLAMVDIFESTRIRSTQNQKNVSFKLANDDEYYLTLHWLDEINQRAIDIDSDYLKRIIHTEINLIDWFNWLYS